MALTRPTLAQLTTGIARISDPITTLHAGYNSANVDIGFLMNRANGLVSNVAVYWNETGNSFVTAFTGNTGETNSNIVVSSYANLTTGHLLPGANVTYSLGSSTQRWKDLWLSGTTIYLGGASISSSDSNTVSITNQNGGSFSITGSAAGQATGTFGNLAATSGLASTSTTTGALVVTGGAGISGSLYLTTVGDVATAIGGLQRQVYANANVAAYLVGYSGSIGTAVSTSGNLIVGGNLIVNGSTSTINNTVFETTEYVQTIDATTIRSVTIGNIGANHIGVGTYLTSLNASNLSSGTVPNSQLSGAYTNITGLGSLTALSVAGSASVSGNLTVGNLTISSGNITIANAGSFIGNAVTGYGALYAGIPSGFAVLPSTPFEIATNGNTYSQLNMQNINNGSNASTDYVVTAGNGTDSTFYGDFGIASNTYSYPSLGITAVGPNDTYLLGVGYNALGPYTGNVGNVVISSSNGMIKFAAGGANVGNVVATVVGTGLVVNATTPSTSTSTGALYVAGGAGITGNAYVGTLYTTSGIRWAGNGSVISTGGGGGAGVTYTASTTAPFGPTVGDQWYYTTGDILYEYQNVGTGSFWIDITSPTITSGNITVPGGDILSPFLLMGA